MMHRIYREELSATVEELERRLKETDDLAFEQEARVAQLEEELFEHIDAEHERVQQLVRTLFFLIKFYLFIYQILYLTFLFTWIVFVRLPKRCPG